MASHKAQSDEIAVILRLVADELGKLTEDERDALLNGTARLQVLVVQKQQRAPKEHKATEGENNQEVAGLLHETHSVEEANAILKDKCQTKKNLEALARFLDLPVQSSDTVSRLRERIVDATVGFRLRSNAIRGET